MLSSAVKMRKEAIEQFQKGGRQDLVDKEQAELEIVRSYMPQPLSTDELSVLIDQALRQVGAKSPADLGVVMKQLIPQLAKV